jgi:hypothetical protein
MVDWYRMKIFDITAPMYKTYEERVTSDAIKYAMERVEHINDGLAVFEVDSDEFDVHFRDADGSFLPRADCVIDEDVPPEKIKLIQYVNPEEVRDRIMSSYGIRKWFLGL